MAPRARCRAFERPSGIASCRLHYHRKRFKHGHGRYETITATATTRAGVTRKITIRFSVRAR